MSDSEIEGCTKKRLSDEPTTTEEGQENRPIAPPVNNTEKGSAEGKEEKKENEKENEKKEEKKEKEKEKTEEAKAPQEKSVYNESDVVGDEELYKSLRAMSFYHGFLPRDDLGVIIRNEGDYLIRVSEIATKKKEGQSGIKRDIILSVCSSDRRGIEGENVKDVKSEKQPGEREIRNLVIRRYDGMFGIKAGHPFATIDALLANYNVSNGNETKENRFLKTAIDLQVWEYRHSAVKLGDKLGEGAYGEVRKGVLQRKGKKLNVAVKLMKGGEMNKMKIREMMNEARLMRNFKHKNVVRFFGVAVVEQPLYILLELVNGGALNTYLQKNRDVSLFELMSMCLGAARGLQYLHANHCIHRDIAARNCLYSVDKVVKLSDFGLSVIGNQFKLCSSQKLPIKWLAPETITTLFFTPKTDVYSYGVMCFEIFAEGEEPWDGVSNTETKRNVVFGRHLTLPDSCPEKLRSFIYEKVFVVDPKRRVVMDDVVRFIEPFLTDWHNSHTSTSTTTTTTTTTSTMSTANAERSEKYTRTTEVIRSVMAPVTSGSTPRNTSNTSNSLKKVGAKPKKEKEKEKEKAPPAKQTPPTPKLEKAKKY